jgi:hypothetical protein
VLISPDYQFHLLRSTRNPDRPHPRVFEHASAPYVAGRSLNP